MIYPRQKLYDSSILKIFFSFKKSKIDDRIFKKNLGIDNNFFVKFVAKGRTALFFIVRYIILKKKKKKILISPFTIFDVINNILQAGGQPIFIDHEINSFDLNVNLVEKYILENRNEIAALVVTHYVLNNSSLLKLQKICRDNDIDIIQDCAISLPSKINNQSIVNYSEHSFFSFNTFKFLPVLYGGAVVTKNESLVTMINDMEEKWNSYKIIDLIEIAFKTLFLKLTTTKDLFDSFIFPIFKIADKKNIKLIKKFSQNDPNPFLSNKIPEKNKRKMLPIQIKIIEENIFNVEAQRLRREKNYFYIFNRVKNNNINLFNPNNSTINSFINFPVVTKDRQKLSYYLYLNNVDHAKYFYRDCSSLKIFKDFTIRCKNVSDLERNLLFLPIYHTIKKNYLDKIIKVLNEYK